MKRILSRIGLTVLIALGLAATAQAQPATTSGGSGAALLNLDNTVALHGYDAVAFFERKQAVRGNKAIKERLGGATYYFASRANRYTFLQDAPKYQPQMGGFCVTSMAMGRTEDINPQIFEIYLGKLYLFKDDAARAMFLQNPPRTILEATENYHKIASRRRSY